MLAAIRLLTLCAVLYALCFDQAAGAHSGHRHGRLGRAAVPVSPADLPPPSVPHSPVQSAAPLSATAGTVGNLRLDPAVDCALRAFAIEVATARRPSSAWSNWTALAEDAFQMAQCNATTPTQPSASAAFAARRAPSRAAQMAREECAVELFVDAEAGSDLSDGSEQSPFASLPHALSSLRQRRKEQGSLVPACLTLRGGRHYLGRVFPTAEHSRVGGLHLTPADSNLVVRPYGSEAVTLSGGVPLPSLNWTTYATTAAGKIMQAVIPSSIALSAATFNELYIDGVAAVRAKFPNGDPFFHGLYSTPTGYADSAASWLPKKAFPAAEQIHIATPSRNGTYFQYFDLGVGGGAAVFDPPTNFWSVARPTAGDHYGVPGGLVARDDVKARMAAWGTGVGGLVHAFHSGRWGSWIFDVDSINAATGTIAFGRGGFQEARGNSAGGQYYVSNLLAELDAPNEWFFDADSRTLYFMPNTTMPAAFVAAQRACLVSMDGSEDVPVQNVTIRGMTFTESSHTFMDAYEAPASGDWSIHRGGAVFLHGTENVAVVESLFTELGSNAVVVSDWNLNVTIDANEFVWLGDSAILVVGSSNLMDGVTTRAQPDRVTISRNLFHETGAYVKQSAPTFVSLSREVLMTGNVAFNMPRSSININDGFAGNKTISYNVFFNAVRETADHGPINVRRAPSPCASMSSAVRWSSH